LGGLCYLGEPRQVKARSADSWGLRGFAALRGEARFRNPQCGLVLICKAWGTLYTFLTIYTLPIVHQESIHGDVTHLCSCREAGSGGEPRGVV
jgi:hypothetical protein